MLAVVGWLGKTPWLSVRWFDECIERPKVVERARLVSADEAVSLPAAPIAAEAKSARLAWPVDGCQQSAATPQLFTRNSAVQPLCVPLCLKLMLIDLSTPATLEVSNFRPLFQMSVQDSPRSLT